MITEPQALPSGSRNPREDVPRNTALRESRIRKERWYHPLLSLRHHSFLSTSLAVNRGNQCYETRRLWLFSRSSYADMRTWKGWQELISGGSYNSLIWLDGLVWLATSIRCRFKSLDSLAMLYFDGGSILGGNGVGEKQGKQRKWNWKA